MALVLLRRLPGYSGQADAERIQRLRERDQLVQQSLIHSAAGDLRRALEAASAALQIEREVRGDALPGRAADRYLIEELPIALIAVPQMLPELLGTTVPAGSQGEALLVGDVDFERVDAPTNSVPAAPLGTVAQSARRGSPGLKSPVQDGVASRGAYKPLPGTRDELLALSAVWQDAFTGRSAPRRFTREQATERAVRQRAGDAEFLHLATHGFFAADRLAPLLTEVDVPLLDFSVAGISPAAMRNVVGLYPGLLCGVVLAGANRTPSASGEAAVDDGILTALEVSTLDLSRTRLVVLSACETALGQSAGGEGVLGLQRAFQVAGARTAVTALWRVEDRATRALMVEFYSNLWQKKMPVLDALREAQLAMLRRYDPSTGEVRASSGVSANSADLPPRYWAGFVLSGDWRWAR